MALTSGCVSMWADLPECTNSASCALRPSQLLKPSLPAAEILLCSCQSLQYGHQGMPGRVLKSGCVQVVQNLRIIPDVLHPRSRLTDAAADEVGEVVYVPVYDIMRPHSGPVAVLEALLSARATDSMLVANFISAAGTALAALQVSSGCPWHATRGAAISGSIAEQQRQGCCGFAWVVAQMALAGWQCMLTLRRCMQCCDDFTGGPYLNHSNAVCIRRTCFQAYGAVL